MIAAPPRISLNKISLDDWQGNALEYLRYEYHLSYDDLVIDLGGYQGEFTTKIYNQYRCNIIVVEPTEYIKDIRQHEGKIRVINKAAGTHNGIMEFGGGAYYTSVFEENSHSYQCFDINSLLSECGEIALLKINIEGCEYDLLQHIIGAGLHKKCRNIQVQFHEIAGVPFERWYDEIAAALSKTHELTWRYPFVWENWMVMG